MFKKITSLIVEQIKMGATPEKLTQSVIAGIIVGIIPYLGTSTLVAAFVASRMKLNHILTQTVNYLMYPVQLIMIPIYIKLVGFFFNVGATAIRPDVIYKQFIDSPSIFIKQYSLIGLYAFFIWIPLGFIIYFALYPIILKIIVKFKERRALWNG